MSEPIQFFADQNPKPETYLHYWFANADIGQDMNTWIHAEAQSLIQPQLTRFQQNLKDLKTTIASNAATKKDRATLLQLADISVYDQDVLENILAPHIEEDDRDLSTLFTPKDLEEASNKLTELKNSTARINQRFPEFCETVQKLVGMFDPTGEMKGAYGAAMNSLWQDWKAAAVQRGYITKTMMESADQTKTAREAIKYIMDTGGNNNQIFKDLYVEGQTFGNTTTELTVGVQKMLILAQSLQILDEAGKKTPGMRKFSIKKGGSDYTFSSGNEILTTLIEKMIGLISNVKGQVAEDAVAEAYFKGHVLLKDEFKHLEDGILSASKSGTDKLAVSVSVDDNHSFLKALEMAEQKYQAMQTSKADDVITITQNGVSANIGFSVKTGHKLANMTYDGSATIDILGGPSLLTLLGREMHLSSQQFMMVMQLLAGHGDGTKYTDSSLNEMWNDLKPQLAKMAFVDALTGSNYTDGQAHFMIVGGSIISMEKIILNMMQKESNLSAAMTNSGGSLNRERYMALNSWDGLEDTPDENPAMLRSEHAYGAISKLLAKTKMNINLKIANMQMFRALG